MEFSRPVEKQEGLAHALMDTPAVESLHGALCRGRIVVLDKAVVETFALELKRKRRSVTENYKIQRREN